VSWDRGDTPGIHSVGLGSEELAVSACGSGAERLYLRKDQMWRMVPAVRTARDAKRPRRPSGACSDRDQRTAERYRQLYLHKRAARCRWGFIATDRCWFLAVKEAASRRTATHRQEFLARALTDLRRKGTTRGMIEAVAEARRQARKVWRTMTKHGEVLAVETTQHHDFSSSGRGARLVSTNDPSRIARSRGSAASVPEMESGRPDCRRIGTDFNHIISVIS